VVLSLPILCGESCLLVSWCVGDRCDMADSDEDRAKSRIPDVEDRGRSSTGRVLSGRTIERSGDAVCGLHHTKGDDERGFLGLASKPRSTVSPGLALKLVASRFPIWASKSTATVW
jgi:hypothetical protein